MTKLVGTTVFAREYKKNAKTIETFLTKAGLTPQLLEFGRGTMKLFEEDKAREILAKKFAPKPAPAPAPAAPAGQQVFTASMSAAIESVKDMIQRESADVIDEVGKCLMRLDTLERQGPALLKAIEALHKRMDANGFVQTSDVKAEEQPKPPKHDPAPAAGTERARKPRVAVVGLLQGQQELIKDMEELFDIRFFKSDEAKGREFVNGLVGCSHAFVITKFISHFTTDALKTSNTKTIMVPGGFSTLKDKMKDHWMSLQGSVGAK